MHTKRAPARGAQSTHIPLSEQRLPTQPPERPVEYRAAPNRWQIDAAIGKKLVDLVVKFPMCAHSCVAFALSDAAKIGIMRDFLHRIDGFCTTNVRRASPGLGSHQRDFRIGRRETRRRDDARTPRGVRARSCCRPGRGQRLRCGRGGGFRPWRGRRE